MTNIEEFETIIVMPRLSYRLSRQGLEVVKIKRRDCGLTQYMWATRAEISESTLKRFLKGKPIDPQNFIALCKVLGIEQWREIVEKEDFNSTIADIDPMLLAENSPQSPERSPKQNLPKSKGQLVVTGIFDEDQRLEIEALLDHLKTLLLKCSVTIKVSEEREAF